MATSNVIKEFSQDGVYYLELRTTPRQIEAIMTYEEYLDAVVRGIEYENKLFLGLLKFRYFFFNNQSCYVHLFESVFTMLCSFFICLSIHYDFLCFLYYSMFSQCKSENIPIIVKLLPSIDRSRGLTVAERIVDLTLRYAQKRPDVVVGLDVSGNMTTSNIQEFFPLLEKVRHAGLKLAVHTAEIHNDVETEAILRFRPDRIGHGTFIPPIR